MNWEAIGAIGEVLGAIGVIASLLYLAIQVRASTRAAVVEAKLESTRLLHKFIDYLIETPELNDIFLRGIEDLECLSEEEYYRFSNMALKAFWFFSAAHFQYRMGTLDEGEFHEPRTVFRYWIHRPGCRAWWNKIGSQAVSPKFREFVEAEIAGIEGA